MWEKTNINDDYKRHAVLRKWRNQWLKEIKGEKNKEMGLWSKSVENEMSVCIPQ